MRPDFSVCIPYYRGEETIERCLRSVREQRGVPAERVAIHVVSDGGDHDRLGELCERYDATLVVNERPAGLAGNWSAALATGEGRIVTLLHQDDWYGEGCLAAVAGSFEADPQRIAVTVGTEVIQDDGPPVRRAPPWEGDRSSAEMAVELMRFRACPAPSTTFMSGDLVAGLGAAYSSDYRYCPELDLYLRLAAAAPDGRFAALTDTLLWRRGSTANYGRENAHLAIVDYCRVWAQYPELRDEVLRSRSAADAGYAAICNRINTSFGALDTLDPVEFARASARLEEVLSAPDMGCFLNSDPRIPGQLASAVSKRIARRPHLPVHEVLSPGLGRAAPTVAQRFGEAITWPALGADGRPVPDPANGGAAERSGTGPDLGPAVLIVGFHHSGTRLVAELLDRMGVFQVASGVTHEWRYVQMLNMLLQPAWNDAAALRSGAAQVDPGPLDPEELARRLRACGYRGGPWGHKDPRTGPVLGPWLSALPEARVVHVVRDPLDVLGTLPEGYARFTEGGVLPQQAPAFWADLYAATIETTRAALPRAAAHVEVSYEALCADPVRELTALRDLLGLDGDVAQLADGIRPGTVGKYRRWVEDGRLGEDAVRCLEEDLAGIRAHYGYGA